ncbi:MAG: sulfur carrier protein ThiS [Desulfobulbus sp.]|nr:sulfur carrier protein ThiS [Desulfobulbus sp.]
MDIFVNGMQEAVPVRTIIELVAHKGLEADSLVVELNQRIIKQELWPETRLQAGDKLELLNFVGGG